MLDTLRILFKKRFSTIYNLNRSEEPDHAIQMISPPELNGYIIHQKDMNIVTGSPERQSR